MIVDNVVIVVIVVDAECCAGLAIVDNVEFSAEKQQQASSIDNIGIVTIATDTNTNIDNI